MDRVKVSNLEPLLKFPGSFDVNSISSDAAVTSCGCIVSEAFFNSLTDATGMAKCPECLTDNVSFLKPIKQLRDLYNIIQNLQLDNQTRTRRRSSSKKSIKTPDQERTGEHMDLIGLFYKYAKEENQPDSKPVVRPLAQPIDINVKSKRQSGLSFSNSTSISPLRQVPGGSMSYSIPQSTDSLFREPFHERTRSKTSKYEDVLISNLSEEKEYNFSKCFPFHRKLSTFQTQLGKLFSGNIFKGAVIKKAPKFVSADINTYTDLLTGQEITRFVLMAEKRWELYEVTVELDYRPVLICCGKLSGEYGLSYDELRQDYGQEIVIRNDFSGNNQSGDSSSSSDLKKKIGQWELLACKLSPEFLTISGTKGIMRVFNISKTSLPHEMGKPVYTYCTNFPIRCIAVANNDPLIACGITAKERLSGKEQPFVVLHKLVRSTLGDKIIASVEPITITIPYRDPIKLISFNSSATHLMCCTVWESRYLIIRLRSYGSENFRKPRLIWTDLSALRAFKRKKSDGVFYDDSEDDSEDDALMMDNEGITDAQFGNIPNTVVLTSCSLQNRPPIILRLDGSNIDPAHNNRHLSDALSIESSVNSRHDPIDDDFDIANIKSSDLLLKIQEVGFSIHKMALLPRRDAIAFLDKDGRVYLVSIPNFELNLNTALKKIVVLLGDVANAERYVESAAITFSADGGRVYVADRKGIFLVFDFTKGIPGQDSEVVKCKIISA